jgi:hypothetical protein
MLLNELVKRVNEHLAGELFNYEELKLHLDAVIDDINNRLNSTYPAFSEFTQDAYPEYPNYNFFPDKYLRTVVAVGAAFYFYVMDEEGAEGAVQYNLMYQRNLFYMERDYSHQVPEEYRSDSQGALDTPEKTGIVAFYDDLCV